MLMMVVRESKASTGELMHRDFFLFLSSVFPVSVCSVKFLRCVSAADQRLSRVISALWSRNSPFGSHEQKRATAALQHNNLTDSIF